MIITREANKALTDSEITKELISLRKNALVKSSKFAVAAILAVRQDDKIYYFAGANAENPQHNRLTLHAEQTAICTMLMTLGNQARFSTLWLMGGPADIQPGSTDDLANNHVTPCGHCRQLLIGFAEDNTPVYSITVNGKFEKYTMQNLLPESFSEKDMSITPPNSPTAFKKSGAQLFTQPIPKVENLLHGDIKLHGYNEISFHLNALKPHVIDPQFKTSPIDALFIKLKNGVFVPGVVIQNPAFLSTDALFVATSIANSRYGSGEEAEITEIHLLLNTLFTEQPTLSGAECDHIRDRCHHKNINIYGYSQQACVAQTNLKECYQELSSQLKLEPNTALSK